MGTKSCHSAYGVSLSFVYPYYFIICSLKLWICDDFLTWELSIVAWLPATIPLARGLLTLLECGRPI